MSRETTNCLFQESWWLDAAVPGGWDVVEVRRDGRVVARLPFVVMGEPGKRRLGMPRLTQTLGPWVAPSVGSYAQRVGREMKLMGELINLLPPCERFDQNFHYSVTNWLPFYWRGFRQTTKYTYVLADLSDLNALWKGMRSAVRNDIRKARDRHQLSVRDDLGVDIFWQVNEKTFRRQGLEVPYSPAIVRRLDEAAAVRGCRRILFAVDEVGTVHATLFMVWDHRSAYYLMGGADSALRGSGAMSLLLWTAICFAASVTAKFDFEGSMMPSVEPFFRGFGAIQVPYFSVSRW